MESINSCLREIIFDEFISADIYEKIRLLDIHFDYIVENIQPELFKKILNLINTKSYIQSHIIKNKYFKLFDKLLKLGSLSLNNTIWVKSLMISDSTYITDILYKYNITCTNNTCDIAALYGNISGISYAINNGSIINKYTVYNAIESNNLNCFTYVLEKIKINENDADLYNDDLLSIAINNKSTNIVNYLLKNGFSVDADIMASAAYHFDLDFIKMLREKYNCPWNEETIYKAVLSDKQDIVKYCIDNGCPYDGDIYKYSMYNMNIVKILKSLNIPWDDDIYYYAIKYDNVRFLKYIMSHEHPIHYKHILEYAISEHSNKCTIYIKHFYKITYNISDKIIDTPVSNKRKNLNNYNKDISGEFNKRINLND